MRITIITQDGFVSVDSVGFDKLDLSSLDSTIHAVQWYGTYGEIEIKDARGRMVENREITSFDEFAFVIPLWEAAKIKSDAEIEAAKQAQTQAMAQMSQ
jgi:hypothetical protein